MREEQTSVLIAGRPNPSEDISVRQGMTLLGILALPSAAFAQEIEPWDEANKARMEDLNSRDVALFVSDETLRGFVSFLRLGGTPLWIDPRGIPDAGRLTFSAETAGEPDTTLAKVIATLVEKMGLDWVLHEGIVVVTSRRGKKAFESGRLGGPSSDELRNQGETFEKLKSEVILDSGDALEEVLERVSEETGLIVNTEALSGEMLASRFDVPEVEITALSCLRLLSRIHRLSFGIENGALVLRRFGDDPEKLAELYVRAALSGAGAEWQYELEAVPEALRKASQTRVPDAKGVGVKTVRILEREARGPGMDSELEKLTFDWTHEGTLVQGTVLFVVQCRAVLEDGSEHSATVSLCLRGDEWFVVR